MIEFLDHQFDDVYTLQEAAKFLAEIAISRRYEHNLLKINYEFDRQIPDDPMDDIEDTVSQQPYILVSMWVSSSISDKRITLYLARVPLAALHKIQDSLARIGFNPGPSTLSDDTRVFETKYSPVLKNEEVYDVAKQILTIISSSMQYPETPQQIADQI